MFKKCLLSILLTLACLVFAGFATAAEPYVIAYQSDITGRGSVNYAPAAEGFRLYIEALNDRGGINGHPVKVVYEDDKSIPARAGAIATKLILEDKVLVICGLSFSHSQPPVYKLSKEYGVPLVIPWSCTAGVFDIKKYGVREIFATGYVMHRNFNYMGYMEPLIMSKFVSKNNTIACFNYSTPGGRSTNDWYKAYSEKLGYKIVYSGDMRPGGGDASPFALKISDSKADVVMMPFGGDLVSSLLPALEKVGWTNTVVGGWFMTDDFFKKAMQSLIKPRDNIYIASDFAFPFPFANNRVPEYDKIENAMQKYGHKYGLSPRHASGWVTAGVVTKALQRSGWPTDRQSLISALEKTDFDTKGLTGGNIRFTPNDHYGPVYGLGYRWDPIKKQMIACTDWMTIDPKEVATNHIVETIPK